MSAADFVGRVADMDSLVAFFPGVAQHHRQDVQDALLYAHLFASHTYGFQTQWHSWMHSYRERLDNHGFQAQGVVSRDALVVSSAEDLLQATFGIVGPLASEPLVALVRQSFASLGVTRMAEQFFQGQSLSMQTGSFQMMPCEMSADGQLTALLCSLRLNVDDYSAGARRLIFHFKGGAYLFEPAVYDSKRQEVRQYLSSKANAFVRQVELETALPFS